MTNKIVAPSSVGRIAEDVPIADRQQVACRAAIAEGVKFDKHQSATRSVAKVRKRMVTRVRPEKVVFRPTGVRHGDDYFNRLDAAVDDQRRYRIHQFYDLVAIQSPDQYEARGAGSGRRFRELPADAVRRRPADDLSG